ncbi:MAG: hypothetical protein ACK5XX_01235 [Holosporales bacterium]|jgi:hypothetical protein
MKPVHRLFLDVSLCKFLRNVSRKLDLLIPLLHVKEKPTNPASPSQQPEMAVSGYFRVLREKRTAFSGVNTARFALLLLTPSRLLLKRRT